ncbi:helix-turn-helix domain-containing protein, partial [Paraburkholderia sp. SIMBA_050]
DKDDADRYRAPALDKGLDILELLAEQKSGLTRAEITKLLGRNASEMYRMLERLVARQYVVRSAGGDRYSLSLKLYALAHRHPPMNR